MLETLDINVENQNIHLCHIENINDYYRYQMHKITDFNCINPYVLELAIYDYFQFKLMQGEIEDLNKIINNINNLSETQKIEIINCSKKILTLNLQHRIKLTHQTCLPPNLKQPIYTKLEKEIYNQHFNKEEFISYFKYKYSDIYNCSICEVIEQKKPIKDIMLFEKHYLSLEKIYELVKILRKKYYRNKEEVLKEVKEIIKEAYLYTMLELKNSKNKINFIETIENPNFDIDVFAKVLLTSQSADELLPPLMCAISYNLLEDKEKIINTLTENQKKIYKKL